MSKELFEQALIKAIRRIMSDYDNHSKNLKLTEIASIELSSMGNFTDPESGVKYGYKFIIGEPDFFEDKKQEQDDD